MAKLVYDFTEGNKDLKDLLGGKGANLAEMTNLGLPVPPGFIITTEACREYLREGAVPAGLADEVSEHLRQLEEKMGRQLGDPADPLLVSVRSGAKFSMPGMMETVLNIGLSDESVHGLAKQSGSERFAWDSYRRLIQMFGKTVLGIEGEAFEHAIDAGQAGQGHHATTSTWTPATCTGSWRTSRASSASTPAATSRRTRASRWTWPSSPCSARGTPTGRSCTGARSGSRPTWAPRSTSWRWSSATSAWTPAPAWRSPATRAPASRASTATTCRTRRARTWSRASATPSRCRTSRRSTRPSYAELIEIMETLENHYQDLCDIEFTIERGKLWMLQTRVGKRTAGAAFRIATQLVDQGLIDMDEALTRVTGDQLAQLMFPRFDVRHGAKKITTGISASPGAAVGKAVFDSAKAVELAAAGEAVILVRRETNPDDLHGMIAAQGILTSRGGKTSHAAVVARGMGKTCVCGAEELEVGHPGRAVHRARRRGRLRRRRASPSTAPAARSTSARCRSSRPRSCEYFEGSLDRGRRRPGQRRAPDHDPRRRAAPARRARQRRHRRGLRPGPPVRREGIGLIRTEHMFLGERRQLVERLILAEDEAGRQAALDALEPLQRGDFVEILEAMDGLPVTIRLIDPPLHEFLPDLTDLSVKVALAGDNATEQDRKLLDAVRRLHEQNPMLGLRGVRLGLVIPGLLRHAGPRDRARRGRAEEGGRGPEAGDHDPAGRVGAGDGDRPGRDGRGAGRGRGGDRRRRAHPDRHDDRGAAGGADRRRDRQVGRVLLLRHQRPDPDGLGLLPRRRGGRVLQPRTSSWASSASRRSRRSTPTASAGWSASRSRRAARPGRT